jgi:hypothetical protein
MANEIVASFQFNPNDSVQKVQTVRQELASLKEQLLNIPKDDPQWAVVFQRYSELKGNVAEVNRLAKALDPNERANAFLKIGSAGAGMFAVMKGAGAIFDDKNSEIAKNLEKVQGAMAVLAGIKAFDEGIKSGAAMLQVYLATRNAVAATTVATEAQTVASVEGAAATEAATVATEGLNTALKANPYTLIAIAVIALVSAIIAFSSGADKAKVAQERFNDELERTNEILDLDLQDIKRNTDVRVAEAERYGKKSSEVTAIKIEGLQREITAQTQANADNKKLLDQSLGDKKITTEQIVKLQNDILKGDTNLKDKQAQIQIDGFKRENEVIKEREEAEKKKAEKDKEALAKHLELKKQYAEFEATLDKEIAETSGQSTGDTKAVAEYNKRVVDIEALQKKELTELKKFKADGLITETDYQNQINAINTNANSKIVLAAKQRDTDLQAENKKAFDTALEGLKQRGIREETDLTNKRAKGLITEAQYQKQLIDIKNYALTTEKALTVKYNQDSTTIDNTIAKNNLELANKEAAARDKAIIDRITKLKLANQAILDNDKITLQEKAKLIAANKALLDGIVTDTVAQENAKTAAQNEGEKQREEIGKKELAAKKAEFQAAAGLLDSAAELAGKQSKIGKQLAAASTLISTYQSAQAAFTGMATTIPGPVGIGLGIAAAAAAVISGLARVKQIEQTEPGAAAGSSPSAPVYTAPSAGSYSTLAPTIGTTNSSTNLSTDSVNQIAQAIANQPPITAVVVETDVTNSQARVASYNQAAGLN